MKKADMESHHASYDALMAAARAAEAEGQYQTALRHALAACRHADGMMRYRKKMEERAFSSVSAIDLVLRYAPLLLDRDSIVAVEDILKASRRIERNTAVDEREQVAAARERLVRCHQLWHHLEWSADGWQAGLRRKLGGDQDEWRAIAHAWERMGLLRRVPRGSSYTLHISTHLDEVIDGKCPSCGMVANAPKAMFLERSTCPGCAVRVQFVLLATREGE